MANWYITNGTLHCDEITSPTNGSIPFAFTEETTELIIPLGVREIDNNAFCSCEQLKSVVIPDTVEKIGEYAFNSTALESVTIPRTVRTIGKDAFSCCGQLRSVILGYGIEEIGVGAFYKTAVEYVCIPDTVRVIGMAAFADCSSLAGVSLPKGLEKIEERAFTNTALKHIDIPASVQEIGPEAFCMCRELESLTLREGLERIEAGAFYGHKKLKRIAFPESLTNIESLAFSAEISMTPQERFSLLIEKFGTDADEPCVPCGEGSHYLGDVMLESISFGSKLRWIDSGAFFGCHRLTDVELPESVVLCGDSAFAPFDLLDVFESLCSLNDPDGERKWYITDGVLHNTRYASPLEHSIPFEFSEETTSLVIPEGVRMIAANTFAECEKLRELIVPGSVKQICEDAFYACYALDQITLKEGVHRLCDSAFNGCLALQEITLPAGLQVSSRAFNCCFHLKRVRVMSDGSYLSPFAFLMCHDLEELILPAGAPMPEQQFFTCDKLRVVFAD